jgi:hypothetical protein
MARDASVASLLSQYCRIDCFLTAWIGWLDRFERLFAGALKNFDALYDARQVQFMSDDMLPDRPPRVWRTPHDRRDHGRGSAELVCEAAL